MTEQQIQQNIADYLRVTRPNVIFHSDFGSGVKLTMGQAVRQKRLNGGRRAWPDLFIAEPVGKYHGLFIELKKDGTRLKKKDGTWATDHIKEQAVMLTKLEEKGYRATFAIGYGEAIYLIEEYLGGKENDIQ